MCEYQAARIRMDIQAACAKLTEQQRSALLLWADGYTYREIADRMRISQRRAGELIELARRNARRTLE